MHEEAVVLYAKLAAVAMASFISSKDTPLMEPVRLNDGFEESRDALKKFRGEEDDDFQFLEYQVCVRTHKHNSGDDFGYNPGGNLLGVLG
jgi:hypothetical protein